MATIAYIRVSTEKQELENQRLAIMTFAQKERILIDDFVEIVISTRKKNQRKHFNEAVQGLKKGDMLIVSEISRVGRSLGSIISQINKLIERKVSFISVKENIRVMDGEQDFQTKIMITMFGLFAEAERDLISQRTKEGLARAKASGKTLGRPKGRLGKSKLDGKEREIAGYLDKKISKASICKLVGVTPPTLDNFIKTRKLEAGELLKRVL